MDYLVSRRRITGSVFIIDDDPAMRDSLQALFEVRGFDVESYDTARSFRSRRDRSVKGCLIVDLDMTEANGLALLRSLAADGLPIVALSSRYTSELRARALAAGAVACIDNPIEPARLLETVFQIMPAETSKLE